RRLHLRPRDIGLQVSLEPRVDSKDLTARLERPFKVEERTAEIDIEVYLVTHPCAMPALGPRGGWSCRRWPLLARSPGAHHARPHRAVRPRLAGEHHAVASGAVAVIVIAEVTTGTSADEEPREEHHRDDEHDTRDDADPHQERAHLIGAAVPRGWL